MKLKPIVASLVLVGLMPTAFAYDGKSVVVQQAVVNQNSVISTVCSDAWFDRISIGGIGSIVGLLGSHDLPGSFAKTNNSTDLFVNNANLLVDVALSHWSKFTLNVAYLGSPSQWQMTSIDSTSFQNYKVSHGIFADEAYVTFANLAKHPIYAKIGKMYVPFGEYSDQYIPWQIESPAQMLSQTNGLAAVLGVAPCSGFYASLFGLKGDTSPIDSKAHSIRNWGSKFGFSYNLEHFRAPDVHVNVNASYIHNIWDSLTFTPNTSAPRELLSKSDTFRDAVGGIGAHVDFAYKMLSIYADWVGTFKNLHDTYPPLAKYTSSSKFWGANVNAACAFKTLSHDSSLGAGFQFSGNGQWFADKSVNKVGVGAVSGLFALVIPKWRALAEYKISLCKYTDLSLIYAHSRSYDFSDGHRNANLGLARLAVRF